MSDEHDEARDEEQADAPEEAVEDLEPGDEESDDVGGGFKRGWPS